MTKRPTFTEAEIARFVKVARASDPQAIIEIVTDKGSIRILPAESQPKDEFTAWKRGRENRA